MPAADACDAPRSGDEDPVIDVSVAERSVDRLRQLGMQAVEFKVFQGLAHSCANEEIDALEEWLRGVLPAEKAAAAPPAGARGSPPSPPAPRM